MDWQSIGAHVVFKVSGTEHEFTVFTTRCDTLFGATYCVMSPEHELVDLITTSDKMEEVVKYKSICATKSDLERTELNKEKTGVFIGAYAINPVNGKEIPIYISDYVLASYGTGAIMAVPAHDDRDYEFAKKFNIEIIQVLDGGDISECAYTDDGIHINSDFLDGLNKEDAINKMLEWLEANKCGKKQINYKMRDWIFARQRYWGEPVPVIHMEDGTIRVLSDEELPLILPELDDYQGHNGKAPLENANDWKNVLIDGVKGVRETSTMPGSAGSSWYFLRYIDAHNDKEFANYELLKHWMPVDLYIGGPEHAVGHLMYSRIWNRYLYDKGLSPVKEPYKKLVHQGMILGSNGIKMGKRFPEYVVNPSDVIRDFGADTLRLYEMFMGPLEASKPWSQQGVIGASKFLDRVYRLISNPENIIDENDGSLDKVYNQTVKKVTEDYENLGFNTAISQMMIFINECYKIGKIYREYANGFVKLISPIVPHLGEELWEILGHDNTIAYESWPTFDESKMVEDVKEIAVQVNGKVRATIRIAVGEAEESIKEKAMACDNVKRHLEGLTVQKVLVIKDRIVTIVAK